MDPDDVTLAPLEDLKKKLVKKEKFSVDSDNPDLYDTNA